jgi:hypothetical protein
MVVTSRITVRKPARAALATLARLRATASPVVAIKLNATGLPGGAVGVGAGGSIAAE